MADYLEYDGQTLIWMPGGRSFRATSGLPGFQEPDKQCTKDAGPIPEGKYYLQLRWDRHKYALDDGKAHCQLLPGNGLQYIPRGGNPNFLPAGSEAGACEPYWANWGWRRVRLDAADQATTTACRPRRSGFYLHDSSKGYSHGCIEVESAFFNYLVSFVERTRQRQMLLLVKYKTATTYGGTLAPSAIPAGR